MTEGDFMDLALDEARKAVGRTAPNPVVGAVVVKGGKVLAVGHHDKAGAPHAEVVALKRAGAKARGSTLYVTLEPCNHVGRTPPCTEAILAAGVKRVVAAVLDPNPAVRGGGLARLRRAGVRVEVGLGHGLAERLNQPWFHFVTTGLPYVTLKAAITADGKLATGSGDARWISSARSRELVQRLRDRVDAVLVGAGTVRADDPQLTARLRGSRSPLRVVLDGRLRSSAKARVYRPGHVVFSAVRPKAGDRRNVIVLAGKRGRLPLRQVLRRLGELGVVHLMVEGGAGVFTQFIERGLWDDLRLFVAPKLAGPGGLSWFQGRSAARMRNALRLGSFHVRPIPPDMLLRVERDGPPSL